MDVFSLLSPSNCFSPPTTISPHTMSSTAATMGSLPSDGSSPFVTVNWGLPTSGPEAYPPHLGKDEFAIVNPDFWGATKEEQDAMTG